MTTLCNSTFFQRLLHRLLFFSFIAFCVHHIDNWHYCRRYTLIVVICMDTSERGRHNVLLLQVYPIIFLVIKQVNCFPFHQNLFLFQFSLHFLSSICITNRQLKLFFRQNIIDFWINKISNLSDQNRNKCIVKKLGFHHMCFCYFDYHAKNYSVYVDFIFENK